MSERVDADVLMFFLHTAGAPAIGAESTSLLAGQDARLMSGFVQDRFFEVSGFTFGVELDDKEGGGTDEADGTAFGRWRSLRPGGTEPSYKVKPQEVSVTRRIDSASPVLLQYCLNKKQFRQAVIVKRSRIGGSGLLSGVLRLDFQDVFIRAIEWEDGDTVTETCKFSFAAVKADYIKRKSDGTVDTPWHCEWASKSTKKTA